MQKRKWLVALNEVDEAMLSEAGLPPEAELSSIPDRLDAAMRRVAPGALALDSIFLLTDAQKKKLETYLEDHSLHYHTYSVDERGERCRVGGCPDHANKCVILRINDYLRRREGSGQADQDHRAGNE